MHFQTNPLHAYPRLQKVSPVEHPSSPTGDKLVGFVGNVWQGRPWKSYDNHSRSQSHPSLLLTWEGSSKLTYEETFSAKTSITNSMYASSGQTYLQVHVNANRTVEVKILTGGYLREGNKHSKERTLRRWRKTGVWLEMESNFQCFWFVWMSRVKESLYFRVPTQFLTFRYFAVIYGTHKMSLPGL